MRNASRARPKPRFCARRGEEIKTRMGEAVMGEMGESLEPDRMNFMTDIPMEAVILSELGTSVQVEILYIGRICNRTWIGSFRDDGNTLARHIDKSHLVEPQIKKMQNLAGKNE